MHQPPLNNMNNPQWSTSVFTHGYGNDYASQMFGTFEGLGGPNFWADYRTPTDFAWNRPQTHGHPKPPSQGIPYNVPEYTYHGDLNAVDYNYANGVMPAQAAVGDKTMVITDRMQHMNIKQTQPDTTPDASTDNTTVGNNNVGSGNKTWAAVARQPAQKHRPHSGGTTRPNDNYYQRDHGEKWDSQTQGGGRGQGSSHGRVSRGGGVAYVASSAPVGPYVSSKHAPVGPYQHGGYGYSAYGHSNGAPGVITEPVYYQTQQKSHGGKYGGNNTQTSHLNESNDHQSADDSNTTQWSSEPEPEGPVHPALEKLKAVNQYNPKVFDMNPKGARFFVIKSYSEDDVHRSIKYGIWCSTEQGNKKLDQAYREREGKGPIYLLYSVNGSGHFCGMAQMMSPVDYNTVSGVWSLDNKWKGQFQVKWIYVKDVPNSQLRHIRLENNENKPVTNSRDCQEVPADKGIRVLKTIHAYKHKTSIFDDFGHYEKEEEDKKAGVTKS